MLNKQETIKMSELKLIKEVLPQTSINEAFKLRKTGSIADIIECRKTFPKATIPDIDMILNSRRFVRWCLNNRKAIALAMIAVPTFSFAMYKLEAGSLALDLFTQPTSNNSLGSLLDDIKSIQMRNDGAVEVFAAESGGAGFFAGKGVILLHMLVVGFFTLIVSSFLKFTGRGDFIPLVAFVGGAAILYEVVGLFRSIYDNISTLLNM